MLKYTKTKFKLLTDIDKLMFIKLGIRGGESRGVNHSKISETTFIVIWTLFSDAIVIRNIGVTLPFL